MIIFGSKGREERRGIVAEHCPVCDGPRAFAVTDIFEVPHVYFVGVGQGTYQGTCIKCAECSSTFQFNSAAFSDVLPIDVARQCSFEDIVARTNPRLAEAMGLDEDRPLPPYREVKQLPPPAEPPPPDRLPAPGGSRSRPGAAPSPFARAALPTTCQSCGYSRARPFKFCPRCGQATDG